MDLTTGEAVKTRALALSAMDNVSIFQYLKSLALVSVAMNDTYTTLTPTTTFTRATNGSVFCRPNFESHLFFDSQWIFNVTTSTAPTQPLTINLQTWLNQYHILISPSGFANDWTITLPAVGANQTWTFTQTFRGGIFNLELRKAPDFHLIEFLYNMPTQPTGWNQVQIKPRLTLVHAIPSSQISFVRI
jgi:hypothetical protein